MSDLKGPDSAFFTLSDVIVLDELYRDINDHEASKGQNQPQIALDRLSGLADPKHPDFQPTVFCAWDAEEPKKKSSRTLRESILQLYTDWARTVVRHETDVVFLTHIILYFVTAVPSALYLFHDFHLLHGIAHLLLIIWYSGAFTLMMHNHIHNNGVLSKPYAIFDWTFPYILEPLMGHTWDSYYYHHVKAHHVEGNGPDDLSSTIRYQRDSVVDFLQYELRFLFLCWVDLPLYFISKRKYNLAVRVFCSEISSYTAMVLLARWNFKPTLFVLILPFVVLRFGLMIGNWGQHALVDEVEPDSDFRSSITLIDVPSNRFCFNDGYHTSHHLNPRRHWRDHPRAFLQAKERYADEGALVFQNIDYLEITFRCLTKNYMHLAKQLVPIGKQIGMSQVELAEMLKTKTRKFSEEEIAAKFAKFEVEEIKKRAEEKRVQ
ncbi:hypothetical protein LCER1_G001648 [Lachnellula cervina]|uniref:Fatty acid desaturase domain-containing protein n=1 Tax=Lachnellula cervina TaxID=1316786 RepID=A0A7D8Z309_9HELO|nr:hypothetical protein LCER1_G001648 [Lachnellula cervina]